MRLCDICSKRFDSSGDLTKLRTRFQTKDIKEVCDSCYKRVNDESDRFQVAASKIVVEWVQAFMVRAKDSTDPVVALSDSVVAPFDSDSEDALVRRIQDKMLSNGVLNSPRGRFRRLVRWWKCH